VQGCGLGRLGSVAVRALRLQGGGGRTIKKWKRDDFSPSALLHLGFLDMRSRAAFGEQELLSLAQPGFTAFAHGAQHGASLPVSSPAASDVSFRRFC